MKTFFNLHFTELKFHFNCFLILYCLFFIISYIYNEQILFIIIEPLFLTKESNHFIFTSLNELILLKLTTSNLVSLILSFYILIIQFWVFNYRGFKKIENFYYLKYSVFYILLSLLFIHFFFETIIPTILNFLIKFKIESSLINVFFEPRIYNFVTMIFNFFFIFFGLFNYIFFFLLFLKRTKKVTIIKYRKFIYFKILLLTTFFSPPDLFSQFIIGVPIIFIFESLIFFKFFD